MSRNHDRVNFGTGVDSDSSDSEPDTTDPKGTSPKPQRPWLNAHTSSASSTTLAESDSALSANNPKRKIAFAHDLPDYSDSDGELGVPVKPLPLESGDKWQPGFLKKHSATKTVPETTNALSAAPPNGAVEMTPSLFKALDRVAVAQQSAHQEPKSSSGASGVPKALVNERPGLPESKSTEAGLNEGLPKAPRRLEAGGDIGEGARVERWQRFWKDVHTTALTRT